ncbi:hypothetical protein [Nostoc sp.]|uniref:hypothetical protein n=1 Tax=Nostoc sp. TaxID=1180 RepID=UPI002FFD3C10
MLPCGSSLIYGFNDTAGILRFRINLATQKSRATVDECDTEQPAAGLTLSLRRSRSVSKSWASLVCLCSRREQSLPSLQSSIPWKHQKLEIGLVVASVFSLGIINTTHADTHGAK